MIGLALAAVAAAACPAPEGTNQWVGSQVKAYAQRSVEIVALAASGDEKKLAALVDSAATFSIGAGDVGRPLGTGVQGARAFVDDLKAASYAYNGWDYIPQERNVCGPQDVEVQFVTSDGSQMANVTFHYDGGVLRSAAGWWRSLFSGPVKIEKH